MGWTVRKLTAIIVAALMLGTLSACGEPLDKIKEEAKFSQVCESSGGRVYYNGMNGQIECDFTTVDK